jgi:hypothetical protein
VTGQFGLSIPNQWSSVPWLTTRHARLNSFKAGCFRTFGQLVRAEKTAFEARHGAQSGKAFPIQTIVLDNEITYWGAGNPGMSSTLQADFNPAIVAAALAKTSRSTRATALPSRRCVSSATAYVSTTARWRLVCSKVWAHVP